MSQNSIYSKISNNNNDIRATDFVETKVYKIWGLFKEKIANEKLNILERMKYSNIS